MKVKQQQPVITSFISGQLYTCWVLAKSLEIILHQQPTTVLFVWRWTGSSIQKVFSLSLIVGLTVGGRAQRAYKNTGIFGFTERPTTVKPTIREREKTFCMEEPVHLHTKSTVVGCWCRIISRDLASTQHVYSCPDMKLVSHIQDVSNTRQY